MDDFLWWSGVAAWGAGGVVGFFVAFDASAELIIKNMGFRRAFLDFFIERLKSRGAGPKATP